LKYASLEKEGEDGAGTEPPAKNYPVAREYYVFNVDQVQGYEVRTERRLSEEERIEHAEECFRRIGAEIRHGAGGPHYDRSADYIHMPPFGLFRQPVGYYSVLAHEVTHWTGATSAIESKSWVKIRR
jgi:antirestriction protein ArdC